MIFYPKAYLESGNWKEVFLKKELEYHKINYVDTKSIIIDYAFKNKLNIDQFYDSTDGHHNNFGNIIISKGILKHLKVKGYI